MVLQRLAALLGPNGLLTDPADLVAYQVGARYGRGLAAFVARPETTQAVSAAMALCHAAGITLIPQGANTGLVDASGPDMTGTQGILSLERLKAPLDIDPVNRSVRVGAGVRLSALNAALAEHDLCFPIDLGADPAIGGMVATNTGGARLVRYGDVRRHVLGLEVVLADGQGTVLDLSARLRKNNTGVDLKHLFIGTAGAFGVITRIDLEVRPMARESAAALLVPRDDAAIGDLLVLLEQRASDYLSAFESMSRPAMERAFAHIPSLRNPFAGGQIPEQVLLVELSRGHVAGDGPTLSDLLEGILADAWERDDAPLADAVLGRPEDFWAIRHSLNEGVKASGQQVVAFDLSFARSDVNRFRAAMRAELAETHPHITVCDYGHVGDGGIHFNLAVPPNSVSAAQMQALRDRIYDRAVHEFEGSFSAEHGVGRMNQAYYHRFTPALVQHLAGALGAVLAPQGLGVVQFGPTPQQEI